MLNQSSALEHLDKVNSAKKDATVASGSGTIDVSLTVEAEAMSAEQAAKWELAR